ncbi:DUF5992 family protein [Pseudoalteromonas sp. Of7M-16]|uniref:DUF5992 family protein n=1 Tax=Pseudoalteromonas sp. Of7M-16 TaxID=2917756 RepID=UPI001EF4AECC|nr:DUF5992 family protein [Pseudoalteromonas sp. Of7M-16]MCG7547476.1 DUF5992 family protein [Pseudoalteromonas sp. Of7M-16]
MKKMLCLSLFILPFYSGAGELVRDAVITEVASTSSNKDVFYVKLSGGTGPCANGSVEFPANKSQSEQSYNQAFSIALAASMSGKKVRIHNYSNNECSQANFIGVFTN